MFVFRQFDTAIPKAGCFFFQKKIIDIFVLAQCKHYIKLISKKDQIISISQNKLLWAISEKTAAELVYRRADAALPLMGMLSFDKTGVPVRKGEVSIAKNYLKEDEIKLLGLIFLCCCTIS